MPRPARRGRKRTTELREAVNAIRYMVRSGCEWRMLPVHFPPWQTVQWWFRRFVRLLLFRTIHDLAVMIDRARGGRGGERVARRVPTEADVVVCEADLDDFRAIDRVLDEAGFDPFDVTTLNRMPDRSLGWFYPVFLDRRRSGPLRRAFWDPAHNDQNIKAAIRSSGASDPLAGRGSSQAARRRGSASPISRP